MILTRRQLITSLALLSAGASCGTDHPPGATPIASSPRDAESARDVEREMIKIVCDQLGVEESLVRHDSSFVDDLDADSLDLVELVMAFEEEFNISIPDDEAEKIRTVGDAINYVAARKKN